MIKLASEKIFNRAVCPVMNIKGKRMKYPLGIQHKTFGFGCNEGMLGPKQMLVMDIIGTTLVHILYGNSSYFDRVPIPSESRVKQKSARYVSPKLLKYVTDNLSSCNGGIIPENWYSTDGRLSQVDKVNARIKQPFSISFSDETLRQQLPFMRKYSSRQIEEMIKQTSQCVLRLNYPIRFFNGKEYQTFPFNNYNFPSKLFTIVEIKPMRTSRLGHILTRQYKVKLDTILGYFFSQNMISCYMDLLPAKFYELSDYAQFFYRICIMTYFPNKVSGKTPKNPVSLKEIKKRLILKTKDTYMVRQVINRILKELKDSNFISEFREEKIDMEYAYSFRKNSWKEMSGEDETSESDLDDIEY